MRRTLIVAAPVRPAAANRMEKLESRTLLANVPAGVTDQTGTLLATPALTLTVDNFFERGLLGIAFDPSFNASAPGVDYVYLYWTVPASQGGPNNRIARFEVNGNTIDPASQTLILNLNP